MHSKIVLVAKLSILVLDQLLIWSSSYISDNPYSKFSISHSQLDTIKSDSDSAILAHFLNELKHTKCFGN